MLKNPKPEKKVVKHSTYELQEQFRVEPSDSYWATIFVAGEIGPAIKVCRDYCMKVGLCVTIEPTTYIYTGGAEQGYRVGLIQYPPFEAKPTTIMNKAIELGKLLARESTQWSFTVLTPDRSLFFSRRRRHGEIAVPVKADNA